MKITRDDSIKEWLFEEIKHNMGKSAREYITLYDMLYPRKAYFQRVHPEYLTEDEIMYFTTGKGHEEMLRYVGDFEKGELKTWEGIGYRCDVYQHFPCEVKTRRGNIPDTDKAKVVYESYLRQLKQYCAVENKPMGWLWVWALVGKDGENRTKPDMICYRVEFDAEELQQERERIRKVHELLKKAIERKDFLSLPLCPSWICVSEKKEMTKKGYCKTCNREFETEWGLKKHANSKSGKGHEIVMPEYSATWETKCKWWQECQRKIS